MPDGDIGRFASDLPDRLRQDFTGTMNILRNTGFQDLVQNYPKPPRSFLIGYEVEDTVTSRVATRAGQYQNPADYLDAFSEFVRENTAQIEALQILMNRPNAWSPEVLTQLRQELVRHQYREEELQKACERVHAKLADIISIVRRAIEADTPLYTAEERVERALDAVMADKTFTGEQVKWLGYIRQHLIQNLSLDMEDLENAPIFSNKGGRRKAEKVFQDQLELLLDEINQNMAA